LSRKKRFPFIKERGEELKQGLQRVESPCIYSNECGGCTYIDLAYRDELKIKHQVLQELFAEMNPAWGPLVEAVQPSPAEFGHRSKLTLQMLKLMSQQIVYGNCPYSSPHILEIKSCQVADPLLSKLIPEFQHILENMNLDGYRRATISMRSDLTGKVAWGGIGKGSLWQSLGDGFSFEHFGLKVEFSMQTFFQSNLHILPNLLDFCDELLHIGPNDIFYDLYGGVGLFSIMLGRKAKRSYLIEINPDSIAWAQHNQTINGFQHIEIILGAVEEKLDLLKQALAQNGRHIAMIDPPRCGLHASVVSVLRESEFLDQLIYLSCNPESQRTDLGLLCESGRWKIKKIIPWDFFPKSYHVESLAILTKVE
jgi:23S rRNA (uracil1939-C5)-methyltransferase